MHLLAAAFRPADLRLGGTHRRRRARLGRAWLCAEAATRAWLRSDGARPIRQADRVRGTHSDVAGDTPARRPADFPYGPPVPGVEKAQLHALRQRSAGEQCIQAGQRVPALVQRAQDTECVRSGPVVGEVPFSLLVCVEGTLQLGPHLIGGAGLAGAEGMGVQSLTESGDLGLDFGERRLVASAPAPRPQPAEPPERRFRACWPGPPGRASEPAGRSEPHPERWCTGVQQPRLPSWRAPLDSDATGAQPTGPSMPQGPMPPTGRAMGPGRHRGFQGVRA